MAIHPLERFNRRLSQGALGVRDLQQVLESSGDISIGAYARRTQRRRILIGIVGVALILGAVAVYLMVANLQAGETEPVTVELRCRQCGADTVMNDDPERSYPIACPKCGAQAVWPLWQCRYCEHKFLPPIGKEEVRCPMCDSRDVGYPEPE